VPEGEYETPRRKDFTDFRVSRLADTAGREKKVDEKPSRKPPEAQRHPYGPMVILSHASLRLPQGTLGKGK